MKFLWALISLTFLTGYVVPASANLRCSALLKPDVPTSSASESFQYVTRLQKFASRRYRPADFLPESYIALLKEEGLMPSVHMRLSGKTGIFKLSANGKLIAQLYFWEGSSKTSVIIEHLTLENPIAKRGALRENQIAKGLPAAVGFHFKKKLFLFLGNAGFKKLEVLTSESYLVGALYRRMLGGVQSVEGKQFSEYMTRLYEVSSRSFPPVYQVRNLDHFSELIGIGDENPAELPFVDPGRPLTLTEMQDGVSELSGTVILKDPDSGNPIAIASDRLMIFLYKEKDGYRPLFWNEIHERHPDWVKVEVPLGND